MYRRFRRYAMSFLFANLAEIHEWLQAESHYANTFSEVAVECNSTSVICRRPLTSVMEGMPELVSNCSFIFVAPTQVEDSGFRGFVTWYLFGKIRSAPCKNVL